MAVNALVTGLIVFRILKVYLVRATSIERTLGSSGGISRHVRNIVFVIIESGMALFAIQLVRVLFLILPSVLLEAYNFVVIINQMFNVIILSVHFHFICVTDNIYLARASHQHYFQYFWCADQCDRPPMTMNPPWKKPEVFVLIIHQVIRIHFNKWEVVVVCRPKTPTWRGMRIFVLIMIPIHFGKWEVVVFFPRRGVRIFVLIIAQVVVVVYGPRRGLKLLKDIDIQT